MAGSSSPPPARRLALPVVTQNRLFTLLLLFMIAAFFASLAGLGLLALFGTAPGNTFENKFADVCDSIARTTVGVLVGLLCGRAAAPDRLEIPPAK